MSMVSEFKEFALKGNVMDFSGRCHHRWGICDYHNVLG